MTETLRLTLSFLIGAAAGAFFFGGLWWTIRKGITAGQPGLLFLGSFLARTAVVAVVLALWSRGQAAPLALALLGFIAVKVPLMLLLKTAPAVRLQTQRER
ncbi:MAG TPA: ATP synthase subunit I [Chthonomonadaceae bacterium]|nr:ATP synthase subunit I [Chthonomonadaceae bacterium]